MAYAWQVGERYRRVNSDADHYTFFWSEYPVRPAHELHEPTYVMGTKRKNKVHDEADMELGVQIDRKANRIDYYWLDLKKRREWVDQLLGTAPGYQHGQTQTWRRGPFRYQFPSLAEVTDEAIIEKVQNEAYQDLVSPMQHLSSLLSNPLQRIEWSEPQTQETGNLYYVGVYSDSPAYTIDLWIRDAGWSKPKWVLEWSVITSGSDFLNPGTGLFEESDAEEGPSIHTGHAQTFDSPQDALDYVEQWFFAKQFSPMQLLTRSIQNPRDLKGRKIPARYLAGLPKPLKEQRIRELTRSRDAYRKGDYGELKTDVAARKLGLVKQSAYSIVAEARGIEWRGDAYDMAKRVLRYYTPKGQAVKTSDTEELAEALQQVYNKGLAAWKSGGHRPGATAKNWAVARVASLVVGGKAAWTADRKQFAVLPKAVQTKIRRSMKPVLRELGKQKRASDIAFLEEKLRG